MKITKIIVVYVIMSMIFGVIYAQNEDNQIIDAIKENDVLNNVDTITKEDLQFKQFSSCEATEIVLKEYVEKLKKNNYRGPIYPMRDIITTSEMALDSTQKSVNNSTEYGSSSNDFSSTNLQKIGVEEPEIIKTDGNHIYYYNQQENNISILKSPLDITKSMINLDNAELKTTINLPKEFYNTQLFLTKNRLIIIGTRHVNLYNNNYNVLIDRQSRTSIAIYNTSDINNPKLLKFTDLDGRYSNARMIDDQLYVISTLGINRRYYNNKTDISINTDNMVPKAIDIVNNEVNVVIPKCDDISYILPTDDTMENTNITPDFVVVSIINTQDTNQETTTNVLLSQAGEIHMTLKSLYIVQNIRFANRISCPIGARCIMPWFNNGSQTLIHKFGISPNQIVYQTSNIIEGSLLNQYSMDEDEQGNFRILTTKNRNEGTNFYALDNNLDLAGKIESIEPGEQFKSSRYIGDKLYLVTFEQIDPLFVVDIKNIKAPKIIGELKIPGYSTYLHPIGSIVNNKQYIIGLGYMAGESQRGGITTKGIQLSLYEIDYSSKETIQSKCDSIKNISQDQYNKCISEVDTNNIYVAQIANKVLGGVGSYSEALDNPRMFVMDKNNIVTLPIILQEEIKNGENCRIYTDSNGVTTTTDCYPIIEQKTTFAGLKSFKFDIINKTIEEKTSIDYLNIFKKIYPSDSKYYNIYSRQIQNTMMRVGYAGDLLYMINNDFAHFVLPTNNVGKYINFDKSIK